MSIIYNKYINNRDYTWYDSSNVKYSECYDSDSDKKHLKVTFNQGRTYLYKDVDVSDYAMFKNSQSTGQAFNQFIKKYNGVRLPDVLLEDLDKKKDEFINEKKEIDDTAMGDLVYHMDINDKTGEFRLSLNDKVIYEGIENQVSISKLLRSMCIRYSIGELKEPLKKGEDFVAGV